MTRRDVKRRWAICLVVALAAACTVAVTRADARGSQPVGSGSSCESAAPDVTVFADTDGHTTHYDLLGKNAAPKGWDPNVLLGGVFKTTRDGCVVVHFSSHRAIGYGFGDDITAFQVLLDGVPMIGHITACSDGVGNINCLVAPGNSPLSMESYDLFREAKAGPHTLRVLYAGCCTGKGAYVGGSLVTIEHA